MIKRTHEEYLELLKEKFPSVVPLDTYQNSQESIWHKCLECEYIWSVTPNRILSKAYQGCPKCSKIKRNKQLTKTTSEYEAELNIKNRPFICMEEYKGANVKILHKCTICGYEFKQTPHVILRSCVCKNCSDIITSTAKYKEILQKRRPDMEVLEDFQGRDVKILHRHSCGYVYKITPNHVLENENHGGCQGCYRQRRMKTNDMFQYQMKDSSLKILGIYQGARDKIEVQCPKGHIYSAYPSNLLKGFGCPLCAESGGETLIKTWLESHNISFTQHMTFDNLKDKNKLSYDFYLPLHNLLIEFQGKQHEKALSHFGGEQRFEYQKKHDKMKEEYAKNNGYDILYIWYYEQNNIEDILTECLKSKSVETAG